MRGQAVSTGDDWTLNFVTCVSDVAVFQRCLLASPCFRDGRMGLQAFFHARSAADAFNRALDGAELGSWLVWVHQDVVLPGNWVPQFCHALTRAKERFERLAVVGVYGLNGRGSDARRAGHVLDRGYLLNELETLPCPADSLDELLFAVQVGSGLKLDPELGFDFYATDVVLQAKGRGLDCAVVDAYCEHWSSTPTGGELPRRMAERIVRSGEVFEAKWAHVLPTQTSWLLVERAGDVTRFMQQFKLKD